MSGNSLPFTLLFVLFLLQGGPDCFSEDFCSAVQLVVFSSASPWSLTSLLRFTLVAPESSFPLRELLSQYSRVCSNLFLYCFFSSFPSVSAKEQAFGCSASAWSAETQRPCPERDQHWQCRAGNICCVCHTTATQF